jgi:Pyruvate/2-oxoacid:ferredoxin oxidoreductase delta subunit
MTTTVKKRKKAFVDTKYCVGCGVCAKNCPVMAISVPLGIHATVDTDKCVGCSKCEKFCPASTISMQ